MTLDDLITTTAGYTGLRKKVYKTEGVYVGEAALIVDMFRDGFNTAKNMIARERFRLTNSAPITLNSNLQFDTSSLPNILVKIESLADSNSNEVPWQWSTTNLIKCPNNTSGDILTLVFSYVPTDFSATNLTSAFPFPEGVVPPQLLCYFAAYLYFKSKNDDRQDSWLELWNNGFESIRQNRGEGFEKVKDVYGISNYF